MLCTASRSLLAPVLIVLVLASACPASTSAPATQLADSSPPTSPEPGEPAVSSFDPESEECGTAEMAAVSWLGRPLCVRPLGEASRQGHTARLEAAQENLVAAPGDPAAHVWVGRRFAYLRRYSEALAAYSRGIEQHPEFAPLYRHRGQLLLILRRLDEAIADFERASVLFEGKVDEVEPDGLPNAAGIPVSTLQTNTWYHLGLAHYLRGDFKVAETVLRRGLLVAKNPDMMAAISLWLYYALVQEGELDAALSVLEPFHVDMEIYEYGNYHRMLVAYKEGTAEQLCAPIVADEERSAHDRSVFGYGLAMHRLAQGDRAAAYVLNAQIVDHGNWAEFAYFASEADLARRNPPTKGGE
ncbi:MAG: tetratricopeptide repeat protein [Thermoanaerobaculia bacterium]|nr:tetratricopeptide repeat protein [Thermoanaerobaculia bacterium]